MTEKRFTVTAEVPIRADVAVADSLDMTRSAAAHLLDGGLVSVEGKPIKKNAKLSCGMTVTVALPDATPLEAAAEDIPLDILYEDADLLVVNKPKGMVVHPAPGHADGTLVNALLHHCGDSLSGINGVMRPGILHRIDKDTAGLLMVAKNDRAHQGLAAQIKEHSFTREYEAVVYGTMPQAEGEVDAPIGRHPTKRKQMAVIAVNSKPARTAWRVLGEGNGFSHIRCRLYTGRTHQIRVHMAYLGHPLAGDPVYGPKKGITALNGQCLFAKKVGFVHPTTGEYLEFEAALPDWFRDFLKKNNMKQE